MTKGIKELQAEGSLQRTRVRVQRFLLPLGGLTAVIVALLVGAQLFRGGSAGDGAFGPLALPEGLQRPDLEVSPALGKLAPDFLLERADSGSLRLSDLRGKVVFVNWWATWCPPCRAEMPEIVSLYNEYKDQGLVVVGINLQEDRPSAASFIKEFKMTFPSVLDTEGSVARAYQIRGMPSSFFLDQDGVIRSLQVGAMTREIMLTKLERAGLKVSLP